MQTAHLNTVVIYIKTMINMEAIQNITMIFISFSMGAFIGSLWMFLALEKSNKQAIEELDVKTKLLQEYEREKKV